jgi:hypothetical protein
MTNTINTSISVSNTTGNLVYTGAAATVKDTLIYHILGEDVEVSGSFFYRDSNLISNIATLNILGKTFLEELHKNGFHFPTEIEEYLDKKFKSLERDKKINDIIS